MLKYFENDLIVKAIFDNIKNYAVCGLILLVVRSVIEKAESQNGFWCFFHWIVGIVLMIIGCGLWSMNMTHGQCKLQEFGVPGIGWIIVVFLYQVLAMTLLLYFIARAFS